MNDNCYNSGTSSARAEKDEAVWVAQEHQYAFRLFKEKLSDEEVRSWGTVDWDKHCVTIAIAALYRIHRLYEDYLFHSAYFVGRISGDEELYQRLRRGLVSNIGKSGMPKNLVQNIVMELPESLPSVSDLILYDEEIRLATLDGFRSIEAKLIAYTLKSNTLIDIALADPFFLTHDDNIERLVTAYATSVEPQERKLRNRNIRTAKAQLDFQIEQIELKLRKRICNLLEDNVENVPNHITPRLKERFLKSSTESHSIKSQRTKSLRQLIEYADLRELQDVVLSKSTWFRFQDLFENKDATSRRFGQLAELRNAIRHSRTIEDVIQLEGEAAIKWFQAILRGDD